MLQHDFRLVGTGRHEDTLRIENNYAAVATEQPFRLILPTLCITYADIGFANAIGGMQRNYPDSRAYGTAHFDPPVELNGEPDVEKYTWIRGAHRVVIASDETTVEWFPKNALVIPRLRLASEVAATATVVLDGIPVTAAMPLRVEVMQFADGRPTGGLRIEKRDPHWVPSDEPAVYDLWLRVVDGETLAPIPEAKVNLSRWNPSVVTRHGLGGMDWIDQRPTGGDGALHLPGRPADELEALTVEIRGRRVLARSHRPLPGQQVRLLLRAWPLRAATVRYTWRAIDTLAEVAALCGHAPEDILQANGLAAAPGAGAVIDLPCYAATARLEPGDTVESLAAAFAYPSVAELAKLNGAGTDELADGREIELPGWHFFYARWGESLEDIDRLFDVPVGASRVVGRAFHPDRRLPFVAETIAVPTNGFVHAYGLP